MDIFFVQIHLRATFLNQVNCASLISAFHSILPAEAVNFAFFLECLVCFQIMFKHTNPTCRQYYKTVALLCCMPYAVRRQQPREASGCNYDARWLSTTVKMYTTFSRRKEEIIFLVLNHQLVVKLCFKTVSQPKS